MLSTFNDKVLIAPPVLVFNLIRQSPTYVIDLDKFMDLKDLKFTCTPVAARNEDKLHKYQSKIDDLTQNTTLYRL